MTDEPQSNAKTSRRELFRSISRWSALAAVVAGAAWLIRRARWGRAGDAGRGALCARCPVLMNCTLPRAEAARRQGVGLVTPVRRAIADAPPSAATPFCPEGRARDAAHRKEEPASP